MRKSFHAWLIPAAAAALIAAPARAEDIDIYAGPAPAAARPNVLIVLDNSANWGSNIADDHCYYRDTGDSYDTADKPNATSPGREAGTKMGIEKCALYNLMDMLETSRFNVGLMLFNRSPASNSGGSPRQAIVELTDDNKTKLKEVIRGLNIGDDKGNNAAFAKTLYEAYLYLTAGVPYRGMADPDSDDAAAPAGRYVLPIPRACSSHVIFIANGRPGEVTDNEAEALLAAAGGDATRIQYPAGTVSKSDQANWADEFARFMRANASIITHTIAVTGTSNDGNYPNFIENIADKGAGTFTEASSADELADAIEDIFDRIQSASGVFAAASLPISVNARGTYLNQVFMGMFLPDPQARPRWKGNLKQYQFEYNPVTRSLELVDAQGEDAINFEGGFIQPEAVSFWTHSSAYWINATQDDPLSDTPQSDSPDGTIVAKGGVAQQLREANLTSQVDRKVFTCVSCPERTSLGGPATLFTAGNAAITSASLGVLDSDRPALIDWVRGTDNIPGDEDGPGGDVTVRPSIHGDVLHSRPAVVNYGGDIGVVLFYGANDGMLHAVNGEQTDPAAGRHLWSFVPEELFSRLKRLRDNSPRISFPDLVTGDEVAPTPRDYFVDGPVSAYQKVGVDGAIEKVYLYVGMRRGGRFLYAFDVTDPAAPSFLWKITSADIAVLGQTWSEARVVKIKGHSNPVIVMGAGYDPAEDLDPAGSGTMGDAVLVLDAFTGRLIKTFDAPDRAVPADVSVVDSDFDGYVDRAYAVDLGGRVYRIDFEKSADDGTTSSLVADWEVRTLADLGAQPGGKFFFAPDVVLTKNFAVVLVGSGDREKPLDGSTRDYFYTLIDSESRKGMSATFSTISPEQLVAHDAYATSPQARGCWLELERGEKVVNAPLTIGGATYFGTNRPVEPDPNSCSANLGEARSYRLPLICKAPAVTVLEGGGLPPSPVGGVVEVAYVNPATGETETKHVPFIIGGDNEKQSPIEGSRVEIAVPPKRSKVYWYTETER